MKSRSLCTLGLFFAAGCQQRSYNPESATASATITNVKATNCEIFVDKAVISENNDPTTGGGKTQTLLLFIKINADKLDSPVVNVVYGGEYSQDSRYGRNRRPWTESVLETHEAAPDYFKSSLPLVKLYNYAGIASKEIFWHSGAFYVQTTKGTRYWANAATKDNFDFNMDLFKGGAIPELPIRPSFEPSRDAVADVKKTSESADIGRFFNPHECQ